MKKLLVILVILSSIVLNVIAQENIRKVATWNMKLLGTNSGNQLDAIENASLCDNYILKTEATPFTLGDIGYKYLYDAEKTAIH